MRGSSYVTGADILLAFNVEVHDFQERVAFLHDDPGDSSQRSFIKN